MHSVMREGRFQRPTSGSTKIGSLTPDYCLGAGHDRLFLDWRYEAAVDMALEGDCP